MSCRGAAPQFGEMAMTQKDKDTQPANDRSLPPERGSDVKFGKDKPFVEEVEKAMEDQDIPVETGVRPGKPER
jgi:hypothetical protein